MPRTLKTGFTARLARALFSPELWVLAVAVLAIELIGGRPADGGGARDDASDIPWVLLLPLLFCVGCSLARYHRLPLTTKLLDLIVSVGRALRARVALSLGLDFHPGRQPGLPPFEVLRRGALHLLLAGAVLFQARGLVRGVLGDLRHVPGLHTVHVLALALIWAALLVGIAVQLPAAFLNVLELVRHRTRLDSSSRLVAVVGSLTLVATLLVALDRRYGVEGCLLALAVAALLPNVVRPAEPPRGPWMNIALGGRSGPCTTPLSRVIQDVHRFLALEAFVVVCALAPAAVADGFPVTDALVRIYGWTSAWLLTAGAVLAIGEFNRRRRLFDPAYPRSRVLWAMPGSEALALERERHAIERAGWRLVVSDHRPDGDDADLLVGLPAGATPPDGVPLVSVPASLFLLAEDAGAALAVTDEKAKSKRALAGIERLLTSTRARLAEHGEGTFVVPHCWMVVGLTRDDDRLRPDRPPMMAVGGSYQAVLGTRLRRFLHEVLTRAGVDVLYAEDSVTVPQVLAVLERLFDRHVERVEPGEVSETDFMGLQGVRVVLHDVDPHVEGIRGVDQQIARHAISRARILIVGRDRKDDDDDDGPPADSESSDDWLREALGSMFPRLQPL